MKKIDYHHQQRNQYVGYNNMYIIRIIHVWRKKKIAPLRGAATTSMVYYYFIIRYIWMHFQKVYTFISLSVFSQQYWHRFAVGKRNRPAAACCRQVVVSGGKKAEELLRASGRNEPRARKRGTVCCFSTVVVVRPAEVVSSM